MAGILQSIYSSLTALPHPRQQAEPGKGFLSHWHESQEIWAGCKQHQEQGSTFFQAQPTLAHEGGGTDIWWPKQFLNVVPQRSVSGNWQTVPPDHSWKKWRMIQAGSVFCAHGPPGRCTGITITTKKNITVLSNHTRDSSLLTLLWRGNNFLCFNNKLISKSPITQIYKNVFASRFVFGKIQHFNYTDTVTPCF